MQTSLFASVLLWLALGCQTTANRLDAGSTEDGGLVDAGPTPRCNPGIGLSEPVAACSSISPCTELLPTYARLDPPVTRIEVPADLAGCRTTPLGSRNGHPIFDDGAPKTFVDGDGVTRSWCESRPAGAGVNSRRPLLIYMPGSGGYAAAIYDFTLLRDKQPRFDLSGDPSRPGFVLASIQPRNLHWPSTDPEEGTKNDSQYRDLASPSTNQDFVLLDHIIDALIEEGVVDPNRVYVMGWSNGARFASLYGIARHDTTTPGGHRVAAVAIYSGGDPFAPPTFADGACQLDPYPTTALPIFIVSRTCDVIACDPAQDLGVTPGNVVETWVATLRDQIGAMVTWQRIDDTGVVRPACAVASRCGPRRQILNHLRWPDGIWDGGGLDHEPEMLDFLRANPRTP